MPGVCQAGGRGYHVDIDGGLCLRDERCVFRRPHRTSRRPVRVGSPHDHIAASEAQLRSFCSAPRWDALLHWDCGVDEWRYDAKFGHRHLHRGHGLGHAG